MNERLADNLARRFDELRRAESSAAPPFGDSMPGMRPAQRGALSGSGTFRVRRLPVAMLAAGAAATVAFLIVSRRATPPFASVRSVVEWRASTDALLEGSEPPLFRMIPPLSTSVLDTYVP